jgi:hypothetical protein
MFDYGIKSNRINVIISIPSESRRWLRLSPVGNQQGLRSEAESKAIRPSIAQPTHLAFLQWDRVNDPESLALSSFRTKIVSIVENNLRSA